MADNFKHTFSFPSYFLLSFPGTETQNSHWQVQVGSQSNGAAEVKWAQNVNE